MSLINNGVIPIHCLCLENNGVIPIPSQCLTNNGVILYTTVLQTVEMKPQKEESIAEGKYELNLKKTFLFKRKFSRFFLSIETSH